GGCREDHGGDECAQVSGCTWLDREQPAATRGIDHPAIPPTMSPLPVMTSARPHAHGQVAHPLPAQPCLLLPLTTPSHQRNAPHQSASSQSAHYPPALIPALSRDTWGSGHQWMVSRV